MDELDRTIDEAAARYRALRDAFEATWRERLGPDGWRELATGVEALREQALVLGIHDGNRLTVQAMLEGNALDPAALDRAARDLGLDEPPHRPQKRN